MLDEVPSQPAPADRARRKDHTRQGATPRPSRPHGSSQTGQPATPCPAARPSLRQGVHARPMLAVGAPHPAGRTRVPHQAVA